MDGVITQLTEEGVFFKLQEEEKGGRTPKEDTNVVNDPPGIERIVVDHVTAISTSLAGSTQELVECQSQLEGPVATIYAVIQSETQ